MTTQTIVVYRITATHPVDCTDDASRGARFVSRDAARSRASDMQWGEVAECGLTPSTVYEVAECAVVVSEVEYDADEGVVTARITGDGYARSMALAVEPRQTAAGIDGLLATSVLGLGGGRKWDAEVAAVMLSLVRRVATKRGVGLQTCSSSRPLKRGKTGSGAP